MGLLALTTTIIESNSSPLAILALLKSANIMVWWKNHGIELRSSDETNQVSREIKNGWTIIGVAHLFV